MSVVYTGEDMGTDAQGGGQHRTLEEDTHLAGQNDPLRPVGKY